jgi:PAS domain-containing protein
VLALALAAWAFREGPRFERAARTMLILALPAVVAVLGQWLSNRGLVEGARPAELALAAGFLLVAVPLLLPRRQPDWREPWLGSTLLLVAFAHLNIAWSVASFDGPMLWGHVLLAVGMVIPLVGAIRENATLIRSQTARSVRLHRHRESTEVMLDGLPVLVLSLDRQLRVRYANRSASALSA